MSADDSEKKLTEERFDGTMVDLGEDLLETTRPIVRPDSRPTTGPRPPAPPETGAGTAAAPGADQGTFNVNEEVQRGEILFNERLFDEAKKVFRKILRKEMGNPTAKRFLDEIQKLEIQELLGGEAPRKRLGQRDTTEDDNPAAVLERLEKELRISIEKSELKPVPDLFENEQAYSRYRESVLDTVSGLVARDRMDVGIAHLEMGMFDIAQAIFESAVRSDDYKLSGMYLLGLALICGGKAIEATIRLEPLCRDLTLGESTKADYLYLMGLAFERLNDTRKAREFYRRVFMLNPRYRDVVEKLK